MDKVLSWVKNNLRTIEKITLLLGALLIIAIGLVFNVYADTKLNVTVGYLIYGLLTGIAGGAFILYGLYANLFDVKISGLICVGIGLVLGIANILLYPGYLASDKFLALETAVKSSATIILNLHMAFSIVAVFPIAAGFASQLYRKINNIED